MNHSIAVFIPFPPGEEEVAKEFYVKKIGFEGEYGEFKMPGSKYISFLLKECVEIRVINSLFEPVGLFSVSIVENMLGICKKWVGFGVNIKMLFSDPGGYTAIIIDPFGNRIEFRCDSWCEVDNSIDPFEWGFFRKLD